MSEFYKFFVAEQLVCKPADLPNMDRLKIVSFKIDVLNKFKDSDDYRIELNNNVGKLTSSKEGWSLQIDVHEHHASTFLYMLGNLPKNEQKHFSKHSIYARELSTTACNRWVKGIP